MQLPSDLGTCTPSGDDVAGLGVVIEILLFHVHREGRLVLGHVEVLGPVKYGECRGVLSGSYHAIERVVLRGM